MTWEEMGRKYEKEKNIVPLLDRAPKFEKNWGLLIRSTEKLVWLFALSSGGETRSRKIPGPGVL